MIMRRGLIVIFTSLLITSCDTIKQKLGTPGPEDFNPWFQWFVELFTPNDLSNQERIVFTLLILIITGAVIVIINSNRALNFFKEPSFKNRFLNILLLSPTLLMFPLRNIKHPGWALGTWVFLRCFYICFLLFFTFVILFYLAVVLHIIIIIAIAIIILLIISAGN